MPYTHQRVQGITAYRYLGLKYKIKNQRTHTKYPENLILNVTY